MRDDLAEETIPQHAGPSSLHDASGHAFSCRFERSFRNGFAGHRHRCIAAMPFCLTPSVPDSQWSLLPRLLQISRQLAGPIFAAVLAVKVGAVEGPSPRQVLALNGTWEIAEGPLDVPPREFTRTVPVPGLVSLATPPFNPPPGPVVTDRRKPEGSDPARAAFWYRRTFRIDHALPAIARLKVHKAMFTSRVLLNGRLLGDHPSSFTPGYFDARSALREGENELLIRVGAGPAAVPPGYADGREFEKVRYIPGIFDSVELILSGSPHFLHVQTVPEVARGAARVVATLRHSGAAAATAVVTCTVREAASGRIVGRGTAAPVAFAPGAETVVNLDIPIADARPWSPEDPFLYRLEVEAGTDRFSTRFGLREFRLDPATGRAVLNGQPCFLRGTNLTLYRFFEDAACSDLPWRSDWVRLLHRRLREMPWNSVRYCIGFPPEAWYDVADELGILVQDEFPVWGINAIQAGPLAEEYAAWMRERWNHPSVVIWDAQNETRTPITGEALSRVRALDLSGRPWDNGWAPPGAAQDSLEVHRYHYSNPCFLLDDLARASRTARVGPAARDTANPIIVNEYGWLWLTRDGLPTTLTADFYRHQLGAGASVAQRRHHYALLLAADTEFWRSYRQAAGVMHFASLGYSRPDGETSDDWFDVPSLRWDPSTERALRDAFAPVGLMLEFWSSQVLTGTRARIGIRLVNDLATAWRGPVTLHLRRRDAPADAAPLFSAGHACEVPPLGTGTVAFDLAWPDAPGDHVLTAELPAADGTVVRSRREFALVSPASLGLAHGRTATASSSETGDHSPAAAVDGDLGTYWASAPADPSWLAVDLGAVRPIRQVRIRWGMDLSPNFLVQVSRDGERWHDLPPPEGGPAAITDLRFPPIAARHVRVVANARRPAGPDNWPPAQRVHGIREFQVFD